MAAVENPSFEVAGDDPGAAEGWTLEAYCGAGMYAGWGSPAAGVEDFSWYALASLDDAIRWFFDPYPNREGFEDFEEGWSNDLGLVPWDDATADPAEFDDIVIEDHEDFEEGWSNDLGLQQWDDVANLGGAFDEGDTDGFELTPWSGILMIRSAETFEADWTEMSTL